MIADTFYKTNKDPIIQKLQKALADWMSTSYNESPDDYNQGIANGLLFAISIIIDDPNRNDGYVQYPNSGISEDETDYILEELT